jgi:hypothetical protein
LPSEFVRAAVRLHKILPSAFAVTIDILLAPSLTDDLNRLQSSAYLPPVWFDSYIPWGLRIHRRAWGSAEFAIQQAVQRRLVELRSGIEKVLSQYISGYFTEQNLGNSPVVLPAVEIFGLKGTPKEPEKFSEWLASAHGWLESFGTTRMSIDWFGFRDAEMLFVREPVDWNDDFVPPYRLFLLEQESTDAQIEKLPFRIEDVLDAVLPFITLGEFLDRTETTIERLRRKVYQRLQQKSRQRMLGADFRLNALIEYESMLLLRFDTEVRQSEDDLKRKARVLRQFQNIENPQRNLADELPERLKRQTEFLKPHLELSSRLFSNYVSLKNLSANYRLQGWMLFWTIIVSVATFVSLWPQILDVIKCW